ncbi:MAG: hypothetical protein ACI9FB_001435 [Candidatus Azotimanducaceae bacterium]|jgi:hypothetical protein
MKRLHNAMKALLTMPHMGVMLALQQFLTTVTCHAIFLN